jgi:25S rRNA (adenine2142-N1)-methyltransferase
MDWIRDLQPPRAYTGKRKLRMLEVGSLSPDNAVSKSPLFSVTRIDLHSQHPGLIESQDFMLRPLPISDDDKFDVISLSLVLNYVPDPVARGEMLRRTVQFLRFEPSPQPEKPKRVENDSLARFSQSLFLVLPAPCVTNSRYLDERRLEAMMGSIGYAPVYRKLSSKLIYSLWRLDDDQAIKNPTKFKKEEVNPGKFRNNFAMTMV